MQINVLGSVFEDMQLATGMSPASVVPVGETALRQMLLGNGADDSVDVNALSVCLFPCGPYRYSKNGFASFTEYCTGTAAGAVAAWVYNLVYEVLVLKRGLQLADLLKHWHIEFVCLYGLLVVC